MSHCVQDAISREVSGAEPLPVCRPKRGQWYSFPGARWGYGTQGDVYGYKLAERVGHPVR